MNQLEVWISSWNICEPWIFLAFHENVNISIFKALDTQKQDFEKQDQDPPFPPPPSPPFATLYK